MKETIDSYELLPAMAIYAEVVNQRSFSGAARKLGLSRSAVSKQIARLEAALGVRLLNRTTRSLSVTDAGEGILQHCRIILSEAQEVNEAAAAQTDRPYGTLRVSAPTSFGEQFVAPCLSRLAAQNPQLRIRLSLNDRLVKLIDEGFDVAVRIAAMADSSLIARKVSEVRMLACASPRYLAVAGEPAQANELVHHACLTYDYAQAGGVWSFPAMDPTLTLKPRGPFHSNSGEALRAAAIAGLGVVILPDFLLGDAITRGDLRLLFEGRPTAVTPVQVVYPHRAQLSMNVRSFADAIAHLFETSASALESERS